MSVEFDANNFLNHVTYTSYITNISQLGTTAALNPAFGTAAGTNSMRKIVSNCTLEVLNDATRDCIIPFIGADDHCTTGGSECAHLRDRTARQKIVSTTQMVIELVSVEGQKGKSH